MRRRFEMKRRSLSQIDEEIRKAKSEIDKLEEKQHCCTARILRLQREKDAIEAQQILKAFRKSGKSYSQLMTFLGC